RSAAPDSADRPSEPMRSSPEANPADDAARVYVVAAGAHAGLAPRQTTVARPGGLAEIIHPLQRSMTAGNVVVKRPRRSVSARRTSLPSVDRVTRTRVRGVKPAP